MIGAKKSKSEFYHWHYCSECRLNVRCEDEICYRNNKGKQKVCGECAPEKEPK